MFCVAGGVSGSTTELNDNSVKQSTCVGRFIALYFDYNKINVRSNNNENNFNQS